MIYILMGCSFLGVDDIELRACACYAGALLLEACPQSDVFLFKIMTKLSL
jgi:hypothetical protein